MDWLIGKTEKNIRLFDLSMLDENARRKIGIFTIKSAAALLQKFIF
ncbi:MAG: hypothetical protein M3209_10520 [Acidobacteriota bacterium]|nr:hypothetical protein [Acidobacteriota bacterium]